MTTSPLLRRVTRPGVAAQTLRTPVTLQGRGLHTGTPARLTLSPTDAPGWWLEDASGRRHRVEDVACVDTTRCTALALPDGSRLQTVEHVLAAIVGCELDAVVLRLDGGPEVPALDGSAAPFCAAILAAGLRPVAGASPREVWRVELETVVGDPDDDRARVRLSPPTGPGCTVRCRIEFDGLPDDMPQMAQWRAPASFVRDVAPARTFAFARWLSSLFDQGLARGGHPGNAVVFDDAGRVVTPGGLRMADEPARHKMLDLIGDLARLGRPLWADIDAARPGHRLNARVVARLLTPPTSP